MGSIAPALAQNARTGHPQFRNGKKELGSPGHPPAPRMIVCGRVCKEALIVEQKAITTRSGGGTARLCMHAVSRAAAFPSPLIYSRTPPAWIHPCRGDLLF